MGAFFKCEKLFLVYFSILIFLSFSKYVQFTNGVETCSGTAEDIDCGNDDLENENIWKDREHDGAQGENDDWKPVTSQDFNELELEVFVRFFSYLKDWNPRSDTLEKYNAEVLVSAIMQTFNDFDNNDDGYLDYDEISSKVQEQDVHEDLLRIKKILKRSEGGHISLFQYLKFFYKLGEGKVTEPLIKPYLRLKNLPVGSAKKIIHGSVKMFLDSDTDESGQLDKNEFVSGMKKSQAHKGPDGASISDDQLDGLFDLIDKDHDEVLTYSEFQATIPEPPKSFEDSMQEIFHRADTDSDGFLTEMEFGTHMTERAAQMKIKIPTEKEITEIFERLDSDGDEKLNPSEMNALFKDMKAIHEKRMIEAFNSFDQDGDGLISLDELQDIAEGMEQSAGQKVDAKLFMSMLDQDKDGKVSLQEMQGMLTKSMKMD